MDAIHSSIYYENKKFNQTITQLILLGILDINLKRTTTNGRMQRKDEWSSASCTISIGRGPIWKCGWSGPIAKRVPIFAMKLFAMNLKKNGCQDDDQPTKEHLEKLVILPGVCYLAAGWWLLLVFGGFLLTMLGNPEKGRHILTRVMTSFACTM